ncbi:ferrochelatase [Devosia sp. ZB163]|uniref:ferrochelatase n=1 Tax=Devosia sp. ZB163 TaxID=3025938 RepID=UPI002360725F|nr:ferrochelatase [Devosia sp. ZB163]MDC9824972.1 ferrochelatase [Devosia sp. ZB163]
MAPELPPGHPPIRTPKVGVLLLNLGTPDATDYWSVRRYLSEFLSDRRVIEINPLFWQPLLQGIILSFRPQKSGANYKRIWDNEAGDSPLRVISRRQASKLQERLGGNVVVEVGMRYGNPSTEAGIKALQDAGCQKILLAPLYPQYSATTTGTANDKAFDVLKTLRWQPAIRTLPAYFDTPTYVETLAESIAEGVARLDFTPDVILASYHGMPVEYLENGDPYHCQCLKTTRLVREYLGWPADKLKVTFQSRFGSAQWLQPYTDATLEALPAEGKKRVAVVAPAFSVDCIETLEELAITGREQFEHAGGERYAYIPCLNDSEPGMAMLETVVRRELAGWI